MKTEERAEQEAIEAPIVGYAIYDDETCGIEFIGDGGHVQWYSWSEPEILYGISKMFESAAVNLKRVQEGMLTVQELDDELAEERGWKHDSNDSGQALTLEGLDDT